jgi:UDP-glucuronate decarboxylase
MSKKRVLITGGAGFIGSHIAEILVREGNEVIILDNFFTGSKANVSHLLDYKNFELIRHDITEEILLEVDQIYNLACPASPVHYQNNPIKTIKTNVLGTLNMLGMAKRVKARILQASTSEVYGNPLEHPQKETYWGNVNTIGIRSCYDEGKRISETLCFDYNRYNNVDIRVIRIFNTYGPRMHVEDGRVVSNFIVQALQNKNITIFGDGSQTRSFCYVDDLVNGILKMMNQDNFVGPVNLGNDGEFTVKELAEMVISLTNTKSKIEYKPLPSDDPSRRRPDLSLAKEKLNYTANISLKEGLLKTINYFDTFLKNEKLI